MKRIVVILSFLFVVSSSFAQDVYMSSGHTGYHKKAKKKGFDPSKLIVGGGIDAGLSGNTIVLGISPIIGYSFFDNFSAGIGIGYEFNKTPSVVDQYDNVLYYAYDNMFFPSVWARYFVYRNIYVTTVFEYDFINISSTNLDYNSQPYKEKYNVTNPCLLTGVGFKQPLGGRVSAVMEIMYDVLQQPNSPYLGQPIMRIGFCAGL